MELCCYNWIRWDGLQPVRLKLVWKEVTGSILVKEQQLRPTAHEDPAKPQGTGTVRAAGRSQMYSCCKFGR